MVDKRLLIIGVAIVGGAVAGYLLLSRFRRVAAQQPQQQSVQPSQPSQQTPSSSSSPSQSPPSQQSPSQQPPSQSPSQQPSQQPSQSPSKKTYETRITISPPPKAYVNESFGVMGSLLAVVDGSTNPLVGETVEVYVDGQKVLTTTTGGNGIFDIDLTINSVGTHTIVARYPGRETADAVYKPSEASASVVVVARSGTVM